MKKLILLSFLFISLCPMVGASNSSQSCLARDPVVASFLEGWSPEVDRPAVSSKAFLAVLTIARSNSPVVGSPNPLELVVPKTDHMEFEAWMVRKMAGMACDAKRDLRLNPRLQNIMGSPLSAIATED